MKSPPKVRKFKFRVQNKGEEFPLDLDKSGTLRRQIEAARLAEKVKAIERFRRTRAPKITYDIRDIFDDYNRAISGKDPVSRFQRMVEKDPAAKHALHSRPRQFKMRNQARSAFADLREILRSDRKGKIFIGKTALKKWKVKWRTFLSENGIEFVRAYAKGRERFESDAEEKRFYSELVNLIGRISKDK